MSVLLFTLAGTMAAFCGFSSEFLPLAVIAVLFFMLDCVTVPLLQKMVADKITQTGKDSNLIMGFYNSLRFLGAVFGGLCSGYLYDLSAIAPFLMFCAVFVAAGVLGIVFQRRESRFDIKIEKC